MSLDTHPEARRVQIEPMRQAPIWRKMELSRNPHASEAEIRRRLADRILGEELAAEVYGPLEPGDEGVDAG